DILLDKLAKAAKQTKAKAIAIGGGVAAQSGVRNALAAFCRRHSIKAWIPKRSFTTDNASMVAIAGYFKYQAGDFCSLDMPPYSKVEV
ncbi:MAG: tRNA (adenosine(37)-N6)-threonylcarbamoyltransferase complex transferase subunit TsaD, partial [Muribaculaceae bacterium]|nr:tRNA (adenosine(37)-N6)-threonylcarbamoyltransferase complex transferase subunit TsaD [Muribaculaceae bacterium]